MVREIPSAVIFPYLRTGAIFISRVQYRLARVLDTLGPIAKSVTSEN